MPLLRQLEFAFRTVAGIADPGRFDAFLDAGVTDPGYNDADRNLNLEATARELLRANGAAHIAGELHVEWNPRLKTAAGRADCRQEFPRVRRMRRAVACLACCRKHNGGEFDLRFRLRILRSC